MSESRSGTADDSMTAPSSAAAPSPPAASSSQAGPPGLLALVKEKGFWALALLGAVFFFRPLLLGEVFFFRDIYLYYTPIKNILMETLRAGEAPFWNAFLHGGQPLLGDISTTVFYPSNLLYLVAPVARALSLDIVLHALASAAALYLLARRLGLGQPAAVLAGVVYGYCGYTLSQANLYFRLLATPYLPLMLLCWQVVLERRRPGRSPRRWLAGLVALGLLQLLAGSAEMVAFTWLTLLGWALVQPPARGRSTPARGTLSASRKVGTWLVLGAGAAGLGALQLLPLVEMVGQSKRGSGISPETFVHWSLPPRRLPEFVLPGFTGRLDTRAAGDYWGNLIVDSGFPFMLSIYAGAVVIALALLGGAHRGDGVLPQRLRRFLLALLILAAVLSLGRFLPYFELFYRWVPGVQLFRYPIKFLTIGVLPLALLAAEGAELLARVGGRQRRAILAAGWAGSVAAVSLWLLWSAVPAFAEVVQLFFFEKAEAKIASGLRQSWMQMTAVWLAATLAYQLHALRPRAWLPWALAALVALDLTQAGRPVNPTVPAAMITGQPPAATLVAEHLGDGRFYRGPLLEESPLEAPTADVIWLYRWNQEVLRSYLAASYGIPVIFHTDYDGLAPNRVMELKWLVEALPWERRLTFLSAGAVGVFVTEDEVALPAVEKIATIASSGRPFHVYRNRRAARRAELVSVYRQVATLEEALGAMLAPGFDPRQHAVIEGEAPEAAPDCRGAGRIEVLERGLRHRRLRVVTECPRLLVLAEVFYPGWTARVDGRRVTPVRANVAFSALWLAAGEHEVTWRYVPRAFYLGLLISGLTFVGLLWTGRRRPLTPDASPARPHPTGRGAPPPSQEGRSGTLRV